MLAIYNSHDSNEEEDMSDCDSSPRDFVKKFQVSEDGINIVKVGGKSQNS